MQTLSLLRGMKYTPSDRTDIRKTWMRHGWTPSENMDVVVRPVVNNNKVIDDYDLVTSHDWLNVGGFR